MAITPLPTPPNRQDPANFAARGDALLSALPVFVTEANALQVAVNDGEASTNLSASQASDSAISANTSKNSASGSAISANTSKNLANDSAIYANSRANASLVSEIISTNSATLAAGNVQSQLSSIKTQTEAARDAALAGLGAADQSQNLVLLAEGLRGAMDFAGQAAQWPLNVQQSEALLITLTLAIDLAGVVAKQVSGGNVQLAAGSIAEPSLWTAGDRNTGLMFPTADALALITGGLERLRVDSNGYLGIGTNAPSGLLDVADNRLRVRTAKTPASATASGNAGEWCWDAGYFYVAVATNSWKRTALVAW